jgi:hypothetical protein
MEYRPSNNNMSEAERMQRQGKVVAAVLNLKRSGCQCVWRWILFFSMYPMRAMHGTANLLTSYSRRSTATVLALKFVCSVSVAERSLYR